MSLKLVQKLLMLPPLSVNSKVELILNKKDLSWGSFLFEWLCYTIQMKNRFTPTPNLGEKTTPVNLVWGFTVVEVLVVIGVIALLTVIIFPAISEIRAKNRDAERVADIAAIQLGLSLYYNQHPTGTDAGYPKDLNVLKEGKYVTPESLVTPDGGEYIYVPLKKSGSNKCIYYHLGVQLELPSGQIDPNNSFSTKRGQPISNGYLYCGDYGEALWETGIDPAIENMYSVRP